MRRRTWLIAIVLVALIVFFLITRGPKPPTPNPPGTFSFAVLGDAPYYVWEDLKFSLVLQELEANDLSWIIHVGDIFWHPCTDELYRKTLNRFNNLRHPVVYTPGDNEWFDCWESGSGSFAPQNRLQRIREIFFDNPTRSLGRNPLTLVNQSASEQFREFVENARFVHDGIVIATVHIIGSENGMEKFPARTDADNDAAKRRTQAAAAWVRDTFAEARAVNASAIVISFHGIPPFENAEDPDRQHFEPFIETVEEEAERFGRPVLLAHGDGHIYAVDHPLVRRTTGRLLENITRLQVPGSPEVGWVRVIVTPGNETSFSFQNHVVPSWKYW